MHPLSDMSIFFAAAQRAPAAHSGSSATWSRRLRIGEREKLTMRLPLLVTVLFAAAWFLQGNRALLAQGVTTGEIAGTVRSTDGSPVDGARVTVESQATGFTVVAEVREGRFRVQGLEPGGPYRVTVARLGFHNQQRDDVYLRLGERLQLRFVLQSAAMSLEPLQVVAARSVAGGGTETTIPDSLLHRLPTLNRNLYDFLGLTPQVSIGVGLSGGGTGFRLNSFQIQGVPERSLLGNQPPEFAGGRSIPLAAVSEYQVLLSPFDVRYGDFAGALVNAVTRSGTNELRGSVFADSRNDALARAGGPGEELPYERLEVGFSAGGPLKRDRLHFFVASELQRLRARAPGPYVGQAAARVPQVPVAASDLARLDETLQTYGLVAGSAGPVQNRNDIGSLFTRLDLALPGWSSRAVGWLNTARSWNRDFARPPAGAFPLSTNAMTQRFATRTAALQLHTALPRAGGGDNELLVSQRANSTEWQPEARQPLIRVAVPGATGGSVTVVSGAALPAQGSHFRSSEVTLRDDFTLPLGRSHAAALGLYASWFRSAGRGALDAYGTWTFTSLDALEQGHASRYEVERDYGSAGVPVSGSHYAAYMGDRWDVDDRLTLTLGLRGEVLAMRDHPADNPAVDSIFGRRTDRRPAARLHLSPRLGFVWDLSGTGRDRFRGGVGVFTGRPPLAWLKSPYIRYGTGVGVLRCGSLPADLGPPPPFDPDHRSPPAACGDGTGLTNPPAGDVDLLDPDLHMAQALRATLAYDRHLPWGMVATLEGLVTRNLSDFLFVNLNLVGPQGADRNGRVMYGTIRPDGAAAPALRSDSFPSVVVLENTPGNRAYQLSARVEKRFAAGVALMASYVFSRVRDVQTPLRVGLPGVVNWSSGRPVSGRHDDRQTTVSINDVPHRVVVAGTYRTPVSRWATEISVLYVGESGRPFTYVAWGMAGRGDLNADGSDVNDPIYVPRSAFDSTEIRFVGSEAEVSAQRAALERFIEGTPCLDRQRGRIMQRNSCRSPWTHTTMASLRQSIPLGGRTIEAEVDLFNLLNLLDRDWGLVRVPGTGCGACNEVWTRWTGSPALLEHAAQTAGSPSEAQPVFRFDATLPRWTTLHPESDFQMQLGLSYHF